MVHLNFAFSWKTWVLVKVSTSKKKGERIHIWKRKIIDSKVPTSRECVIQPPEGFIHVIQFVCLCSRDVTSFAEAAKRLLEDGCRVCLTACYSAKQALIATGAKNCMRGWYGVGNTLGKINGWNLKINCFNYKENHLNQNLLNRTLIFWVQKVNFQGCTELGHAQISRF